MTKKMTEARTIQDVLTESRLTRKSFLRLSASAAALSTLGAGALVGGCEMPPPGGGGDEEFPEGRGLKLANLDEALFEIDLIEANPPVEMQQEWTLYKVLHHLAQSCEYSMTGYPELQPAAVQAVAKLVFDTYVDQGFMTHDLGAPVPGAPAIPDSGLLAPAFARLRRAIYSFQAFTGELHPHFAYGELTREEWELAHSFHMADHFTFLTYEIA